MANPYAAPAASPDAPHRVVLPTSQNMASRWLRLAGVIVDGLLVGIVSSPINAWAYGFWPWDFQEAVRRQNEQPLTVSEHIPVYVGGFVCFLILHGWLLATRGQTIGKALCGTRIVNAHGITPRFGPLIGLRYAIPTAVAAIPFANVVYGLGNALAIFFKPKRCLHDFLAGTWVVQVQPHHDATDHANEDESNNPIQH